MKEYRSRAVTLIGLGAVIALGLGSRHYGAYLPTFVARYAGDTLWALGVFLGICVCAPRVPTWQRAGWALMVSSAVEISQLYQAPWLNALRHTTLGRLVLGFGFLWSDFFCYTVGIIVGAAMESLLIPSARSDSDSARTLG